KGWVTKAAIDQAEAAFDGAEGELNLARTHLGSAERELGNTRLVAPFNGAIASRDVEPFMEVSGGQSLFLINSEDALDIVLSVPDSVVTRLSVGAPVTVDVSTIPGCGCAARITQISPSSGPANAVPVTAALLDNPSGLLPGMAAEASVVLSGGREARGFLVPLVAIAPGDDAARGYVFKYDEATNLVSKVPIRGGEGIADNLIEIVEGVAAGDIIAAAGVSFLRDGQRVKLLGQ
ncbi:MAG: efflux RND transporter periplasmic adaptor subunit, partial [Gammaproteobacteria bacterium]|nr:efflux RND transporter periplasmic adaptor subunit [Gammaproteobacteria bacterium]